MRQRQLEVDSLKEQIREQREEHVEVCKETEQDADRELVDLQTQYEKRCMDEREAVSKLKNENLLMKKKYNALQVEIDTHKSEIAKINGEEKKMQIFIKSLEKDVLGLRKEVNPHWLT